MDDADVKNCLALLTFLPMEEVERLGSLKDAKINEAKERLAFEITRQVHGEEEATKAMAAARALFSGGGEDAAMPSTQVTLAELEQSKLVIDMLTKTGLTKSRGEGRRLISGGGIYVNGQKVEDEFQELSQADIQEGSIMLRKGKKGFHKVIVID